MANIATWTLRDLVKAVFRHKKKGLVFSALTVALGTSVILFFPRKYRSDAKVFLQRGRETVGLDPTATTGQTISLMQSDRQDEVQSALDVIQSRGVLGKVVDLLTPEVVLGKEPLAGDDASPRRAIPIGNWIGQVTGPVLQLLRSIDPVSDRERAILKLEESLEVDSERNSTVFVLMYDAKSPLLAQKVLEGIVQVYREEHARIHGNDKSRGFFDGQRELLRSELEQATRRLQAAKNSLGLTSIESRSTTLESLYGSIQQSMLAGRQEADASEARVAELEQALQELPRRLTTARRSIPNEGADLLRDQLYQLQVRKSELESRYSETHPLVRAIHEQVDEAQQIMLAEQQLREETTDDVNPIHSELLLALKQEKTIHAGHLARLAALTDQRQQVADDLLALNDAETTIRQLQRDLQIADTNFFQYAENFEQARIDKELEAAEISNVSMVQEPTFNEKPISPSKVLVALATVLLALLGPVALAILCEQVDDRLQSADDVEEALGAPVLTETPPATSARRPPGYVAAHR
jgi:uncharacterized protein involved in exopolysaccharide biosynthesis